MLIANNFFIPLLNGNPALMRLHLPAGSILSLQMSWLKWVLLLSAAPIHWDKTAGNETLSTLSAEVGLIGYR